MILKFKVKITKQSALTNSKHNQVKNINIKANFLMKKTPKNTASSWIPQWERNNRTIIKETIYKETFTQQNMVWLIFLLGLYLKILTKMILILNWTRLRNLHKNQLEFKLEALLMRRDSIGNKVRNRNFQIKAFKYQENQVLL